MDATSTHPAPLDRGARHLVVLSALVSSLLLWIAAEGQRSGWPPFDLLGGRVAWYVLVIALPTTLALSVRRLDDARFWRQSLGIGLAWLLAAGWAAWQATGEPPPSSDEVLGPFAAIAAIALFVLLPFAQGRLEGHGWHAPYPRLFEHAWGNAYALALGLLAVGLGWLVLWLAAALFDLVGIDAIERLLRERPVIYLATGLFAGLGLLLARTAERAVQVARQVKLAVFKALLPLVALVAVAFVLVLPLTGLEQLFGTRSAAWTIAALLVALAIGLNAAWQDGREAPWPAWLGQALRAAPLAMPVLAAIGLYALWLRIAQYGWTPTRLHALAGMLLLAGYALAYALAALRGGRDADTGRARWLPHLGRANRVMAWAVLGTALALSTPLLDPWRIAAHDQAARLRALAADPAAASAAEASAEAQGLVRVPSYREAVDTETRLERDVLALRFAYGRSGVAATRAIAEDAALPEALRDAAGRALEQRLRWAWQDPTGQAEPQRLDAATLAERTELAAGIDAAPAGLVEALAAEPHRDLAEAGSAGVLLARVDADRDGTPEWLACNRASRNLECSVHRRDEGGAWQRVGSVMAWNEDAATLRASLRAGGLEARRPYWDALWAGERPLAINWNDPDGRARADDPAEAAEAVAAEAPATEVVEPAASQPAPDADGP